jgi:hypothetical protein
MDLPRLLWSKLPKTSLPCQRVICTIVAPIDKLILCVHHDERLRISRKGVAMADPNKYTTCEPAGHGWPYISYAVRLREKSGLRMRSCSYTVPLARNRFCEMKGKLLQRLEDQHTLPAASNARRTWNSTYSNSRSTGFRGIQGQCWILVERHRRTESSSSSPSQSTARSASKGAGKRVLR